MTPCRLLPIVSILAIGLMMKTPDAKAALIEIDSGWTILESPDVVPIPTPGSPYVFDGPWEINTLVPVKLTVTDLYWSLDLFEVWNHGSYFGSGSSVNGLSLFADTPDDALGNLSFSQNSWLLQPGSYSFTFKVTEFASPYTNTQIAFRADSVSVPEGGASVLLFGMAFAGIAGIRKIQESMSRP